jgi:hypothetical protein
VKPVRHSARSITFHLGSTERRLFAEILALYPVVPGAYQPLSKSLGGKQAVADQQLLDEALAEQRAENKKRVQTWLGTPTRFRRAKVGFNFSLELTDAEWLLQVLNDIRVGCWLQLGSPADPLDLDAVKQLDPELHRSWAAMELSGLFQMELLRGLEGGSPD